MVERTGGRAQPLIEAFIRGLHTAGLQADDRELAEILWLSRFLPVTETPPAISAPEAGERERGADKTTPKLPSEAEREEQRHTRRPTEDTTPVYPVSLTSAAGKTLAGRTIRVPGATALPASLEIARALRPFSRRFPSRQRFVFDEEATVRYAAEGGPLTPLLRPAMERWFEVALVVEETPAMAVWRQTIAELQRLLAGQGAFRDVRLFRFHSTDTTIEILSRSGIRRNVPQLRDADGRRLILIVSDCVSPGWRNGVVASVLADWGARMPVVIVQMLPDTLWRHTALGPASVSLRAVLPGVPNKHLAVARPRWDREPLGDSLPMPVVTLEPDSVSAWAGLVMATGTSFPGVLLGPSVSQEIEEGASSSAEAAKPPIAPERVQLFRDLASREAFQLAVYLAAVPLTLPVMRLVQRTMFRDYRQVHLAEVFLGGLLERLTPADVRCDPDEVEYDFYEGVRDVLTKSIRRSEAGKVLEAISKYVEDHTGKPFDFDALILDSEGEERIPAFAQPFARVGGEFIKRLGTIPRIVQKISTPSRKKSYLGSHIRIFLSSPGDVADERALALRVLNELPYHPLLRGRITVETVLWDKPGASPPMLATLTPEEAIAKALPKPSECDIVIVIFGYRMGTPLPKEYRKPDGEPYWSGTEYEYLDALQAARAKGAPTLLVYRKEGAPHVNLGDPQFEERVTQWKRVEAFFAGFMNPDGSFQSYYKTYNTPSHFEKLLDEDLRDLVAQRLESQPPRPVTPPPAASPLLWSGSPFPGLRAFTPADAPIFFGRDRETDGLIRRLEDPLVRFLAVVGASGSGKSSLVAAGLIPRLLAGALPGSQDWVWVRFTPGEVGDNPFMALAVPFKDALQRQGQSPRELADQLAANPAALTGLRDLALAGRPAWAELLLFIDQFEEMFTLAAPGYVVPFVVWLGQAAQTERIRVVVTLRADFYHRCVEQAALAELLRTGSYPLAAPGSGALHEMITRPAERAGLTFGPGLAELILDDTDSEPGALALLAFALFELYKARTPDGRLTHEAYEGFGGVQGAIARRAEQVYKAYQVIYPEAQGAMDAVFRELVEVDERGVATRRRALRRQVCAAPAAEPLVNAFTDARLLVTTGEGGQRLVEVAHEALLRSWPRLAQWIEAVKDDLRLRHQLSRAVEDWQNHNHAKRFQWSDERAVEAGVALKRLCYEPTDLEQRFLGPVYPEPMLAAIDNPATTHQERATIGVRLALVGDPRPGVGLREDGLPDIVWCEVSAGDITLKGKGTFPVKLFHIAKYPVTWVQYRVFVESADGYRNAAWWKGLAEQEKQPGEQRWKLDNHPAERVSWYDAMAFCRWLSARLGCDIRLPTEGEWQQAATAGDSNNPYPWGQDWDGSRTNTRESGLYRTTAVGMYPKGASRSGVLDMIGNVWEWCLNEYEHPERTGVVGDSRRVIRGGSWSSERPDAHNPYRNPAQARDRSDRLGLRVVRAAPL